MPRLLRPRDHGIPEIAQGDARPPGPQSPVGDFDHGSERPENRDEAAAQGDSGECAGKRINGGENERARGDREQGDEVEPRGGVEALSKGGHGSIRPCTSLDRVPDSVDVLLTGPTMPSYAHPGDAGADLIAAESVELAPGQRATVGTGTAIALPDGFAAFVVPRSGLAARHGLTIVNAPGTVDAGYRGELRVTLLNTDAQESYLVEAGDRIAQLIVWPVVRARFLPVESLPGSHRGQQGFGSTGYGSAPEPIEGAPE